MLTSLPLILIFADRALVFGIFNLEPYENRTSITLRSHINTHTHTRSGSCSYSCPSEDKHYAEKSAKRDKPCGKHFERLNRLRLTQPIRERSFFGGSTHQSPITIFMTIFPSSFEFSPFGLAGKWPTVFGALHGVAAALFMHSSFFFLLHQSHGTVFRDPCAKKTNQEASEDRCWPVISIQCVGEFVVCDSLLR